MQKNVASQKWIVFAFEDEGGTNPGEPVTGDAANITANVHIDGGAANAVDDTNPSELAGGYYAFDITAAESNGELIVIIPTSSTANVNVIGVPGAVYTTPANFPDTSITASDGRVDVAAVAGTAQTARDLGASVLLSPGTGTGQISLASGAVTAGTVSDKTGYSLTQAFPTNFADMAITVTTGRVTAGTVSDKTGYSLTATTGLGNQTANITGNLSGSVGSVTGAVGSVTGAVGSVAGNVDGSVASVTGAVGSVTGAVGSVTGSVGSVVGHTAQTGDTYALANGAAGFVAIDTVVDAVKAVTDALPDSGALTSIAQASALATVDGIVDTLNLGIITGAAGATSLTTTTTSSDLTGYADDQLIGRVIIWTSGACDGEATDITDYANTSGVLTFTALTTAPSNGDTFKIV